MPYQGYSVAVEYSSDSSDEDTPIDGPVDSTMLSEYPVLMDLHEVIKRRRDNDQHVTCIFGRLDIGTTLASQYRKATKRMYELVVKIKATNQETVTKELATYWHTVGLGPSEDNYHDDRWKANRSLQNIKNLPCPWLMICYGWDSAQLPSLDWLPLGPGTLGTVLITTSSWDTVRLVDAPAENRALIDAGRRILIEHFITSE
ncbi:hypothetical protein N7535_003886 [Penicillium sp. DV-2018c]|nr:hypothetical protein N7535_003886 [Penicillium sp. DV-2018c]